MQEANATSIEYFRDLERVADLLNGILFHGEGIIKADNLLEKNPVIHKVIEKDGKITATENIPDLSIMVMLNGVRFLVMFQGQTLTHYAMPVRVLNERGTDYYNQWKELKKKHGELKDLKSPEEFLSKMKREDIFYPVMHIIVYFGEKPWTAARNMEELLHIERFPEELRKYFREKPLLIFSLRHFENPQWFHTDLRQVCEILRRTKDKIQLQNYIKENQKVFSSLPEDTYNLLTVMMGIRQLEQIKENVRTKKGDFDMCKAFDDMMTDSERRGEKRGEKRGENLMGRLINELIPAGRIDDLMTAAGNPDYRKQLMMEFGIK